MPNVRCKWYDDKGTPIGQGCSRKTTCEFVHPSEAAWYSAAPFRHKERRGPGDMGPPRPTGRKHSDGGFAGSSSGGGWNQFAAATAGNPVDSGWGGAKRKPLVPGGGWSSSEASGEPKSGGDAWGSGSGWDSVWAAPDTSESAKKSDASLGWGGTGWGSPDRSGGESSKAGTTTKANGGWGETTWGAADDAGGDKDKDKDAASSSVSKGTDGWGDSSWGASVGNDNGGWGGWGTASSDNGGWGNTVVTWSNGAPSASSAPKADAGSNTRGAALSNGANHNSSWSASDPTVDSSGPGNAAPLPVVRSNDAAATNDNEEHAPFGASTAMWLDQEEWLIDVDHPTSTKRRSATSRTKAPARPRSRSRSGSLSRPTSPYNSIISNKTPTHMDYIKALARAIQYYDVWKTAEDKTRDIKKMQNSEHYKMIGDRAADIMKDVRKEADRRCRSAKKRFEEAIEHLEILPATSHIPPSATSEGKEIDALRAHVQELSVWMDEVRPAIARMQTASSEKDVPMLQLPSAGEESAPPPVQRSAHRDPVEELLVKLEHLERRVSSLEEYREDLRKDQSAAIQLKLGEMLFERLSLDAIHQSPPTDSLQPLRSLCTEHQKLIDNMRHDLAEIKQEVHKLKSSQPAHVLALQALRMEQDELRQREVQLKESIATDRQQRSDMTSEGRELLARIEAIVNNASPPPVPIMTPESISEYITPLIMNQLREELMTAINGAEWNMEQTLKKQQEEFCNVVWHRLEPTLRIADAIQMTAEKAIHGGVLDIERSPSPLLLTE